MCIVTPYHAGYFYVPHPHSFHIFIQSNCMIPFFGMYLQAEWKTVWILISWLLRSQLIRIHTVFYLRIYTLYGIRVNHVKGQYGVGTTVGAPLVY